MNSRQWWVMAFGLVFMGCNPFFLRGFYSVRTHYSAILHGGWYNVDEMVVREIIVLGLLIGILFLLGSGKHALKLKQNIVLLTGMMLWLLVFLLMPESNLNYHPYWDIFWQAHYTDYSFPAVLWFFTAGYTILLTPIFAYPLARQQNGAILWSFAVFIFAQMLDGLVVYEDKPIFGLPFYCAGIIGMLFLAYTLKKLRKQHQLTDL